MLLAVVILGLVLGAGPASAAPMRDRVVVLLGQEPAELFPGFVSNLAVESDIEGPMWCGLIRRDNNWKLLTDLAHKLPTLKDGDWKLLPNKKMAITFKIKNTFKWHDGRSVTSEDYVWTLRMRKNPNTPVVSRFVDNKIDNVLAPGPYEFTLQYNEIYAYANLDPSRCCRRTSSARSTTGTRGTSISPRSAAPRWPVARTSSSPGRRATSWSWRPSISTGGQDKPRIRNITFRFILDSTVMTANIIAGEGDASATNNLSLEQVEEIERRAGTRMIVHRVEGLIWEHIDFNLDNEWLKDKRVRQAIAHATDREAIVRNLFQGRQPVAHTFFGPKHFAYNPNVKKYAYDQARARQLLAEAGFRPGPDGILRDAQNRPFRITIMTTAGNAVREQVQQIMKDQLRQVGIDLVIDNRPASVLFGQVTTRRTYPHLVMYAWVSSPTTHFRTIWHSKEIPSQANNFVGQNVPGYVNPEVDRLLEQADEQLDEGRRAELLKRVQEIWAEDLPSLPLYFRLELNVSRRDLKNYLPRGIGTPTWNAEQWTY